MEYENKADLEFPKALQNHYPHTLHKRNARLYALFDLLKRNRLHEIAQVNIEKTMPKELLT